MSELDSADMTPRPSRFAEKMNEDLEELLSPQFDRHKASEREGLPPGYRMRADAHYVEQLTTREAAGAAEAGSPAPTVTENHLTGAGLIARMTEAVTTIHSAAAMLGTDTSPLARRVALDLVKAEAWRASWQLRAVSMLENGHPWQFRQHLLGALLGCVRDGLAPECRLSGMDLKLHVMDWSASADLDEDAFLCAVTGAVIASVGLAGVEGAPQVALAARRVDGRPLAVEIVQDRILPNANATSRFFDPAWSDRPGGWSAVLGAAVAKSVAERHGGDATFLAGDGRGGTVRLTFGRPKAS